MLRGALIEYGTDLIGPIPNVVIFQFNPEQLTRTITIPQPPPTASPTCTSRCFASTSIAPSPLTSAAHDQ